MLKPFLRPLGVRLLFAAFVVLLGTWAQPAKAQTTFAIAFQKLSDTDDSVDDVRSGIPALRQCPAPCQTVHVIARIINCQSAQADGTCLNPNTRPITGGIFLDTPPITLPLDCARGVTIAGSGTSDPAVCDTASNTVTVGNINVPPGGNLIISFWCNIVCDNGIVTNTATFDYDQNPNANPLNSRDPIGFAGASLQFQVGTLNLADGPTKDAPSLPIQGNPPRRPGGYGIAVPWVITGRNPNCAPGTLQTSWDQMNPDRCMDIDCSTLRFFINDLPQPLPAGSLCPDGVRPAPFSLGAFTLQPFDTFRIEYIGTITRDPAVTECCNVMFFRTGTGPDATTSDPRLDARLTPEYTCVSMNVATAVVIDAIKDAEDAAGRVITTVRPGDDIYWRFKLINNGSDPADMTLTDDFPPEAVLSAGAIIDPFPVGTCVITGQHLECTGVTVPDGGTLEMRLRTTLNCAGLSGGDQICNEGTAAVPSAGRSTATHCTTCVPSAPANRTCVTLEAPSFEFARKTATDATGNSLVDVGEVINYRIDAPNSGTSAASNIVITDDLPANTAYVPGSLVLDGVTLTDAADGDAGEVVGSTVTVRLPTIPVLDFSYGIVTFSATVTSRAGTQVCNSDATLTWDEAALCALPPLVLAPACFDYEPVIAVPELSASKRVAPSGTVAPDTVLRYTIGACNALTAGDAANVVIGDDIPAGTTYVAGSMTLDGTPLTDAAGDDAGELTSATHVQWTIPTLRTGECRSAEFDVRVDSATRGNVTNVASVVADGTTPVASNSVTTFVDVVTVPPDLSITKTSAVSGGGDLIVGGTINYSVRACNATGAGDASAVVISDALPLDATSGCGVTYTPGSLRVDGVLQTDAADGDAGRFEAAPAPGGIIVDLASLAAGACVDITFDVTVAAGCDDTETISNKATVSAAGVPAVASNETTNVVTGGIQPPDPNMMRKEGGPLVDRCPNFPTVCGCEVGPRLDPVLDDCVTAGTCSRLSASSWTVPGDLNRHVPLVFYELNGAGCQRAGDPTRLNVAKSLPNDISLTLVP